MVRIQSLDLPALPDRQRGVVTTLLFPTGWVKN
jgi:hypothetical protein